MKEATLLPNAFYEFIIAHLVAECKRLVKMFSVGERLAPPATLTSPLAQNQAEKYRLLQNEKAPCWVLSFWHVLTKNALLNSKIKAWSSRAHLIYTEYGRFVRTWNRHFIRRVKEFTVKIYSIGQHSAITVL